MYVVWSAYSATSGGDVGDCTSKEKHTTVSTSVRGNRVEARVNAHRMAKKHVVSFVPARSLE